MLIIGDLLFKDKSGKIKYQIFLVFLPLSTASSLMDDFLSGGAGFSRLGGGGISISMST